MQIWERWQIARKPTRGWLIVGCVLAAGVAILLAGLHDWAHAAVPAALATGLLALLIPDVIVSRALTIVVATTALALGVWLLLRRGPLAGLLLIVLGLLFVGTWTATRQDGS